MNFSDEEYVRLYVRDTVTWKLLEWQGQTVLLHMLRGKFDRSGVFDCDGHELSHAVTAVTGLPLEIVEFGLAKLLALKVWEHSGERLVWPAYLEAQTCARSDRARQRESREKRRSSALVTPVTKRDNCHDSSQASQTVTQSRAEQSRTENKPTSSLPPADAGSSPGGDVGLQTSADKHRKADARRVFEAWKQDTGHYRAVADEKRLRRIVARLREGFTPEELIAAISHRHHDPFLMGQNDTGKVYDGLETLLRDAAQVERLRDLAAPMQPADPRALPEPQRKSLADVMREQGLS